MANQRREIDKIESKGKSWTARGHILEAEIKTFKSEFDFERANLTQKSAEDDLLIGLLKQDLASKKAEIIRVKATGKGIAKGETNEKIRELKAQIGKVS